MIMFIKALSCGLNGCGSASAGRTSGFGLGAVRTGRMPMAAIPTAAAAAINETTDVRMDVSLPFLLRPRGADYTPRMLYPHGANDGAAEHESSQPIAAVDDKQLRAAHGETIVDQHGREHKASPAEQAGYHSVAQRHLAGAK